MTGWNQRPHPLTEGSCGLQSFSSSCAALFSIQTHQICTLSKPVWGPQEQIPVLHLWGPPQTKLDQSQSRSEKSAAIRNFPLYCSLTALIIFSIFPFYLILFLFSEQFHGPLFKSCHRNRISILAIQYKSSDFNKALFFSFC